MVAVGEGHAPEIPRPRRAGAKPRSTHIALGGWELFHRNFRSVSVKLLIGKRFSTTLIQHSRGLVLKGMARGVRGLPHSPKNSLLHHFPGVGSLLQAEGKLLHGSGRWNAPCRRACNVLLLKVNQIGTLTEAAKSLDRTHANLGNGGIPRSC